MVLDAHDAGQKQDGGVPRRIRMISAPTGALLQLLTRRLQAPTAIRVDQDRGRKMQHRDRVRQRKHTGDSSLGRRALAAASRSLTRWTIDKRRTMTTTTAEVEVQVEAVAALSHTAATTRQARPTCCLIPTPPPRLRIPTTPVPVPPPMTATPPPSTAPKPTPTAPATAGTSSWATL